MNNNGFEEWFTSNATDYVFICELFYFDCELNNEELRKKRLKDWIKQAYLAGYESAKENNTQGDSK